MRDFESSTLWRISAFQRQRDAHGPLPFSRGEGPSLLSTTLLADLRRLELDPAAGDALEVVAACVRHREAALVCLECPPWVWPLTLFPQQQLYHAPRDLPEMQPPPRLAVLRVLGVERPGIRTPGHWLQERGAPGAGRYRPIEPLLWRLAMEGPRRRPLSEIGGRAAYRLAAGALETLPEAGGALRMVISRLKQETAALKSIAVWPGMSLERASRLLNALYLVGALRVSRSHPAARDEPLPRWWQP
ncbi:hypothetical protein [Rubrivivax gelatinosus]|uniref:Uncharacterized protein n=1 Tax=Rubrivivax gelatinosus (strain NBRC 100245 / IL144) TaxID=983917 RepID=I0HVB2_RUBGI|nr:hypothetical protein [Rubrivivax gelatinosus]BAL96949.1 hypothetical protein RGE_36100 [Rubrivivax gelatinosus IL144]